LSFETASKATPGKPALPAEEIGVGVAIGIGIGFFWMLDAGYCTVDDNGVI
jgi:hypothetical protein